MDYRTRDSYSHDFNGRMNEFDELSKTVVKTKSGKKMFRDIHESQNEFDDWISQSSIHHDCVNYR